MERVYWTISIFCILAFAALASGCGGSSQEQEAQTQADIATEAQERFHELNPGFVGPVFITNPAAYLAANGPVIGQ